MDVNLVHSPLSSKFDFFTFPFRRTPVNGNCLPNSAIRLFTLAFANGGYVAGGFARLLAHHGAFTEQGLTESGEDQVASYLGLGSKIDLNSPYGGIHHGDIDLFFPDTKSLKGFWSALCGGGRSPDYLFKGIVSGNGTEIICSNQVRVQVITRYLAPIDAQLRSFDIYNAMVACNDKEYVMPQHWHVLEQEKMLHVVNWSSPFVVHRVFKWFQKHHYTKLSPLTASEIGTHAVELIEMMKKEPFQPVWGGKPINHGDIISRLKPFLGQLNNEDLLMLSSVYPLDAYHGAFRILRDRAGI